MKRTPRIDEALAKFLTQLERELATLDDQKAELDTVSVRRDRVAHALENLRSAHAALTGKSLRIPAAARPTTGRLGPTEARLLAELATQGPLSPMRIAELLKVDRATVKKAVAALQSRGRVVCSGFTQNRRIALALKSGKK